jgi:phospholipid/cholesterol/gamma-HCH transport system substrate-binding protein
MDHRIPRIGVVISLVCAAIAAITFVFLNLAFEGPSLIRSFAGEGYKLEATFADTEILPTKQPVLLRGLEVGKVRGVEFNRDGSTATVEFTIEEEYAPVYADATVAIGERTILGDPYLRLERGTEAAGELPSGSEIDAVDSVDFDEALDFLDAEGRRHVKALLTELKVATRSDSGPERFSATVGELSRAVHELRRLTDALRGQESNLAGLVRDGAIVLDELGSRERALRAIVGSGRVTLDALAANTASLEDGLAELPPLLDAGRRVLADARPLLAEAGPLVADLREAAPEITPVLADLPAITADAVDVVSGLSGVPTLRKVLRVIELLRPAVPGLRAAGGNLVPLLRYTADRANGLGAFFANFVSVTASGDPRKWARFAILLEPGELSDVPTPATCSPEDDVSPNAGFCHNAYPEPNDARDPEPFEPPYPRLQPFEP